MGWWVAIVFGYSLIAGAILGSVTGQHAGLAWALFAGFLCANFLGLGIGLRNPGQSVSQGIKDGARLGLSWAGYMLGMAAASGVAFLVLMLAGL